VGLTIGIVGLPNVGKSTLFNALTRAGALVANYPFATIDPNTGVVEVPDERLARLADLFHPPSVVPAAVTFVDIAGLVRGASEGEGLGNRFLAHIRECDAIAMVVRCFLDPNVTHVSGAIDPRADIEVVETELMLADLETVTRRKERTAKLARQQKEAAAELAALEQVEAGLGAGVPARRQGLSTEAITWMRPLSLLTLKPVIYVANVAEADAAAPPDSAIAAVREYAAAEGSRWVPISAAIEAELRDLDAGEARDFLESMGLKESGLNRLAREAYEVLGLITFFTAGEKECRAWTVHRGATAPEAAGVIHTDFQRGFIRAEVADWRELCELGGWTAAREKGRVRSEGRDYVVQDGDTVIFRFNV